MQYDADLSHANIECSSEEARVSCRAENSQQTALISHQEVRNSTVKHQSVHKLQPARSTHFNIVTLIMVHEPKGVVTCHELKQPTVTAVGS